MTNYQRETIQYSLEEEKKILNTLKRDYKEAGKTIESRIKNLLKREDAEMIHVIHQVNYQKALKTQIDDVLDKLNDGTYSSILQYMEDSYGTGFTSSLYRLQKQGVPLIFPMDRDEILRAVQTNSKISKKKYGKNFTKMKNTIRKEVTRGISTSMSFGDMARNIDNTMKSGLYNSYRVARTEGHRINQEASFDAMTKAKEAGADVVKKWDSTIDGRTRVSHRSLEGQVRELEEPFEVAGKKAMYPSGFGLPSEDINCRCVVLEIGRWELDEDEGFTKNVDGKIVDFSNSEDYKEFREKYYNEAKKLEEASGLQKQAPLETEEVISDECKLLVDSLNRSEVDYNEVVMHKAPLTESEIIKALAGGDMTGGSCASVGLAYCGQKAGMNVLDFRDGKSRNFFAIKHNLRRISELPNVKTYTEVARSSVTAGNKLLKMVEKGKEYYLVSGRHAAIVRRTEDDVLQYLELQSSWNNGWKNFDGNPRYTLSTRFGEAKGYDVEDFMIEVDSIKDSPDLKRLLGYINTVESKQRKGKYGTIK